MSESWADRWRGLLQPPDEGARRAVAAGQSYQRSGRVTDVRLRAGLASARVQGKRATPRLVEVRLPVLGEGSWGVVVESLAGQLRYSARLLAGLTPVGLAEELAARGVALFPAAEETSAACGCDEPTTPCAHVVATFEAIAARIAEEPFDLLRLRGKGREQVLADVAAARGRASGGEPVGLALADLPAEGWRRARMPLEDMAVPPGAPPPSPAAPLRALGDPPGWPRGPSATELFAPLVAEAAGHLAERTDEDATLGEEG